MNDHTNSPASPITTMTIDLLSNVDDLIHFLGGNAVVAVYLDKIIGVSDTITEPIEIDTPECWLYRAVASEQAGRGSFVGAPNEMALALVAALPVKPHFGKVWRFGAPFGTVVNQNGQIMKQPSPGASELYNDDMDSILVLVKSLQGGKTRISLESNIDE